MSRNLSKRLSVFLWHAPEDSAVVSQAYNKFKKISWIKAWLGDERLIGGQERTRAVRNAVYNADVVILFLSTFSTTSAGYVQRDLRMVMDRDLDMPEGTIFVIPLRLNQCEMPYGLEKRTHIDYFPPNKRNSAYNKLL